MNIEEAVSELENLRGILKRYTPPEMTNPTNEIPQKDDCIYCRISYLEQLTCDHDLKHIMGNMERCTKCDYNEDRRTDICYSPDRKHVDINSVMELVDPNNFHCMTLECGNESPTKFKTEILHTIKLKKITLLCHRCKQQSVFEINMEDD